MPTEKNRFSRIIILFLCILFLFQGCAMMEAGRKRKEELLEKVAKQKEAYHALKKDLQARVVKIGALQEEIEVKYGKPENIFDSASEVSNFALWTYEYPDTGKEELYRPVRLYFNNGKLTYWTN